MFNALVLLNIQEITDCVDMVGVVTFYRQYGGVSKVLWLFAIDNYDYYYNKNR